MLFFYNLGIRLYSLLIQIASLKSSKAKQFIKGRENIFERIKKSNPIGQQHIWFHFASLGEFEQGRPVLEKIRQNSPKSKILVTFFSPSGYEIRKNYALADHVFYLPLDTQKHAERFLKLINPSMAIFTKYEYWYHYFTELKKQQVPLYIISGIFRKSQPFFKWYGILQRQILKCVTYFFVQNEESRLLLQELDIRNAIVSGDTRFDRVYENAQNPKKIKEIEDFCGDAPVLIAGSTWLPDEKLLAALAQRYTGWKFIIAPHEIGEERIREIEELFPEITRFSNLNTQYPPSDTLIIDNIGMLSSLYQYGEIAYIGGGFGAGIHNTLEAAAFGLPVIFGPKYQKFQEAKDLLQIEAAFSINDLDDMNGVAEKLKDENYRHECGRKARQYVEENTGATDTIMKHITRS
jgi:3-deoxy-D-manno-octulosonic-acid transferase